MNNTKTVRPLSFALTLLSLLLIIAILFVSLETILKSEGYFVKQYKKIGNAKLMQMSEQDLVRATMQMIYYMEGTAKSFDLDVSVNGETVSMFNEVERAHMVDVRTLYQSWRALSRVFFILFFVVAALSVFLLREKALGLISAAYIKANIVFAVVIAFLGIWIAVDFNSFWTTFHLIFFTNELWLLDPATSRMINMMPLELFFAIVTSMAARFLFAAVALLTGAIFVKKYYCRREKANT